MKGSLDFTASDQDKATWVRMTLDIRAEELFGRTFCELIEKHQISVIKDMIELRDFKGL